MDLETETVFCLRGEPSSFSLLTSKKKILQGQTMARRSLLFRLPYAKKNKHTNIFIYLQRDYPLKLLDLNVF